MFSSTRLQRPLPGQLGCQLFFTEGQRPFCLYVVAGSRAYLPRIVTEVNLRARELGDPAVTAVATLPDDRDTDTRPERTRRSRNGSSTA